MNQKRSPKEYILLALKGMMMGAADAVPGVSGGTIAFITGIYEELIGSIRRFDLEALKLLLSKGIGAFWLHVNGNFLVTLIGGIVISLASFAHIVLFLLDHYPVLLWSFFFGLILASTWVIGRHIPRWDLSMIMMFSLGALSAYLVTSMSPTPIEATPVFYFVSGAIAICAMILPGISGSFILLLLGMYTPVLQAVKTFDVISLGLFLSGCAIGILSFSRVLTWLFQHCRLVTLSLLSGFLLGSLNKVWPWKYTTSYTIDRHGEQVPLVQSNVSPFSYEALTGQESYALFALCLLIGGALIVLLMERGQAHVR